MKTITGVITHEPKKIAVNCYGISFVAEDGLQYLLTVNEWEKNNMQLKRGRTLKARGPAYKNATTGICEINQTHLEVLPLSCPSSGKPKRKRTPRSKGPSRKQCPMPTQAAFEI